MTLRLVLEQASHPQRRQEVCHVAGDLTIGRGADCGWQIDDPDMFVSRLHCTISGEGDRFTVTDASRGGLFLDGSEQPLGAGRHHPLHHGMRLRLGDVVIRAELEETGPRTPPQGAAGFDSDDFFAVRPPPPPPPSRPETLPQPFERESAPFSQPPAREVMPPLFDDPFTLDPVPTPAAAVPEPLGSFGLDDFAEPATEPRPRERTRPAVPHPPPEEPVAKPPATAAQPPAEPALAFFRGLGLDPGTLPEGGSPAEMEALGKSFRLLAEGLVHQLRTRAREKNSVRVAQTVIGSAEVNPLKFLATEDALAALVTPRGRGYLAPDEAINAAYRDLADHQLRTWTALQSSLRRMIDRFDPARFEAEVEEGGLMKSLISGSRPARLWQLYTDRYRDIARSAEDRFLGDVGADFREAYENNRRVGK